MYLCRYVHEANSSLAVFAAKLWRIYMSQRVGNHHPQLLLYLTSSVRSLCLCDFQPPNALPPVGSCYVLFFLLGTRTRKSLEPHLWRERTSKNSCLEDYMTPTRVYGPYTFLDYNRTEHTAATMPFIWSSGRSRLAFLGKARLETASNIAQSL